MASSQPLTLLPEALAAQVSCQGVTQIPCPASPGPACWSSTMLTPSSTCVREQPLYSDTFGSQRV